MEKRLFDWSKDSIKLFQDSLNIILVDAIVRGIEAGDEIEIPEIVDLEPNKYSLTDKIWINDKFPDGGNHRMMGFYLAKKNFYFLPLKDDHAMLFRERMKRGDLFRIGEIQLFDHREIQDREMRKYETENFSLRVKNYPRIDWNSWNLQKLDTF